MTDDTLGIFFNTARHKAAQKMAADSAKDAEAMKEWREQEIYLEAKKSRIHGVLDRSGINDLIEALEALPAKMDKAGYSEDKFHVRNGSTSTPWYEYEFRIGLSYGRDAQVSLYPDARSRHKDYENSILIVIQDDNKITCSIYDPDAGPQTEIKCANMKEVVKRLAAWVGVVAPDRVEELHQQMTAPKPAPEPVSVPEPSRKRSIFGRIKP